jgi:hypothetical protein
MDPFTALSVAAAVVQFVDFTGTLISGTYEIYKSPLGGTKEHADLETINDSLNSMNHDLRQSLATAKSSQQLSKVDQDLERLCEDCGRTLDKLLSVLGKLKAQKNRTY